MAWDDLGSLVGPQGEPGSDATVKVGAGLSKASDGTVSIADKGVTAAKLADGVVPDPYVLPAATATTLGGVKVGEGLSVAEDGTLSVASDSGLDVVYASSKSYQSYSNGMFLWQANAADYDPSCVEFGSADPGSNVGLLFVKAGTYKITMTEDFASNSYYAKWYAPQGATAVSNFIIYGGDGEVTGTLVINSPMSGNGYFLQNGSGAQGLTVTIEKVA